MYSCDFRILPRRLQNAAACQKVLGFTGLCSHDIDPVMKGCLSLDYTLVVLDQLNRAKLPAPNNGAGIRRLGFFAP